MVAKSTPIPHELYVTDLSISRGTTSLVENLSFKIGAGDLIWITGSNGSGKTSLLRCLAGLLRQDTGTIDFRNQQTSIAYLGHQDGHKEMLTVEENLEFWHAIYRSALELENIMRQVDIWHLKDLDAKNLSAGQSRRVALARLLLANADIWLLDEPAAPIDTAGKDVITDLIAGHISNGGIAMIATHTRPVRIGSNAQIMRLGEVRNG